MARVVLSDRNRRACERVVGIPAEKGAMNGELGNLFHHEKLDRNVEIVVL